MFLNGSTRTLDGGANTMTVRNDAGDLRLQGGAASYNTANGITVAATGNVGIGWSTPLYQLHTSSPDFNLGGCLVSQIGNKYRNWNTATLKAGIYNVGGTMAYNDSNGFATFTTNVASGAYFGIAKGIEGPGYYKLYVQLAGSAGTNLTVYANGQSVVLQNVPLTTTQQGFSATLYIGLYSLVYFVCTGPSGSTFTFSDFSLVSTTLYLGAANQTITMKGSLLHMGQQFAVGGNINSFYPVFLDDPDQAYLAPYKFTIFRHNVHQDGTWTGSFNFTAEGHGSHCGNGANWYSWSYYGGPANVNNTSRSQWVARMSQDVSCGGFITVWLRGGSTYYFTGTNIRLYNVNTYGWALEHDSVTYPILTGPDAPLDQVVAAYDSRTWIMNSNRNINLGGSLSVNYAANSTEGYVNINNSTDRVALMITGGVFGTPVNNAATNTVKNNVLLRYRAYGGDYYNSNYLDIRARPHIGGWGPANAAAMFQFCCSTEAGASNSWGQWADSIPMVVSGRSGGQIGMGTEDPAYRLHVNNGSTGGPVCFLQASGVANESNTSLLIGKSLTTKFCGTILWNQKSDTYPNQNFLGFGLYGDDNVIQINGVQVNIVKPTYIAGSMCPYYDNSYTCGAGGLRWSQVWSVNGSIQTSDSNLKHAKPLPYGLRELLQVRTIKFKWKKQDELAADHPEKNFEYFGFCADELHPLFPELVYNEDPKVPIQMNYAELLPVVVNAMKEQQGMINEQVKVIKEQATTIQSLQQRLAKLEQVVSQLVR
jgi:hypothetical protein